MRLLGSLLIVLALLSNALAQTGLGFTSSNPPTAPPPVQGNTPTFVQGVGSDVNDNNGITGNGFVFSLPNTTLTGNALVLSIGYPYSATRTFAISDSCGDTWPAATITQGTASTSNMNIKTYVLPNASACAHTLTVTFDAALKPFQYTVAEFYNVATASPADGSSGASSVACTSAAAGSFTPTTNNNANGGHLLWTYSISNDTVGTTIGTQASAISKTGGSSPQFMHANNISTIPSVSSYDVQATNAAVNEGFNLTQSSGTNCVVAAVALKAATAGTVPSATAIRIKRILHYTLVNPINGGNVLLVPSDGNLLMMTSAAGQNLVPTSAVADSNSQTYTDPSTSGNSMMWYHQNATSGNGLTLTWTCNPIDGQFSLRWFDIVNAKASSFLNTQGFNGAAPGSGSVTTANVPQITPNAAPGLVVVVTGWGTGPTLPPVSGVSGAFYDIVNYTGMTDSDRMDNADGTGHAYYSTTAAQNWNWNFKVPDAQGSTLFATAIAFQ